VFARVSLVVARLSGCNGAAWHSPWWLLD